MSTEPSATFRKKKGGGVEIVGDVQVVDINTLTPNNWNPNKMPSGMMEKFRKILRRHGFLDPVLVRTGNEKGAFKDGRLEIINGEQRWTATKLEGGDRIRIINMGNVPDAQAKALTLIENDLRGTHDKEAVAAIISELSDLDPEGALVDTLPYNEDELDAYRSLGETSFDALDDMPDDVDVSGDGDDDDADGGDEGGESVAEFLRLSELTERAEQRLLGRLEAIADHVKHKAKPGGLLDALITNTLENLGLDEDWGAEERDEDKPKKKKKKKRKRDEDEDEDQDDDQDDESEESEDDEADEE